MNLHILAIGKKTSEYYSEAFSEYSKRITKPFSITIEILPGCNLLGKSVCIQKESELLISKIPAHSFIVIMDERGDHMTSPVFANLIDTHLSQSTKTLCFIIGGSYGLDESILSRANIRLALSKMVLPHELARLVLVEQIYRATTILAGQQYHH